MRTDILERKQEILSWIEENQSKAFICRQLKCKPDTLNTYLEKMNISYSGNKGSKGLEQHYSGYKTAKEYIQGNCISSHRLKQKLIRDGIKQAKCEICGLTTWLDNLIPLELHHIDGNHFNNNFENLQILCPNCHALQPTNSGKNIKTYQ